MRQANIARGIVHVHTNLSADGRLTVAEISAMCRERGLAFAAITDHAEDVDEAALAGLVRGCEEQSDDGLALIPGLEHRFRGGVHILALGQRQLVRRDSMLEAFTELVGQGCLLVAAHCSPNGELPGSLLEMLTAVEIWNVSRHTRYLPASGCAAAYRMWAPGYPNLFVIGGLDMHAGGEWGCEVVLQDLRERSHGAVLDELRAGRFVTRGRFLSFDSRPGGGLRAALFAAGDMLVGVRDMRNRMLYRGKNAKE